MKKLFILLFFGFFLVSCDFTTTEGGLDYSDFAAITLPDTSDQLTQPDDVYYLYFYGPECTACLSIKKEVLTMLALLHDDKVYLVETMSFDDIDDTIAVLKIPTLVKIVDHQVESYFVGTTDVIEELETLS